MLSYEWRVPAGWSIIGTHTGTTVTVQFPNTSVGDTLRVVARNNCSVSDERKLRINLASCVINPIAAQRAPVAIQNGALEPAVSSLEATVLPNPSTTQFTLMVNSKDAVTPVRVLISDFAGRPIEVFNQVQPGQRPILGSRYPEGVYVALLIQGKERILLKLMKLK